MNTTTLRAQKTSLLMKVKINNCASVPKREKRRKTVALTKRVHRSRANSAERSSVETRPMCTKSLASVPRLVRCPPSILLSFSSWCPSYSSGVSHPLGTNWPPWVAPRLVFCALSLSLWHAMCSFLQGWHGLIVVSQRRKKKTDQRSLRKPRFKMTSSKVNQWRLRPWRDKHKMLTCRWKS